MKKYLFVFSLLALVASVACDTSSKASTSPIAAQPQPLAVAQPEMLGVPTLMPVDSMPNKADMRKKFPKKDMMKRVEMTPIEKGQMLKKAEETPVKN